MAKGLIKASKVVGKIKYSPKVAFQKNPSIKKAITTAVKNHKVKTFSDSSSKKSPKLKF